MSSNKPFPSSDLDVFKENSLILDNFVNSQENEYPDRFARKRPTITGIIKEAFNVRTDISSMNETLIGQSRWDVVPKNTSLSLGGDNGALNKQAQALFNRTVMLKVHAKEALRRTYQEVGLNLVEGSFEKGGELNTIPDVLLEEKTGKVYGWTGGFPKVVNKGTLPTSEVEFVDKTNLSGIAKHKTESKAHPISSIENLSETLAEIENLNAKVNSIIAQLGTKREVCLVNALGTGIENEIVEPLVISNIGLSKTITLPNPFGNNTPVICIAEINYNNDWGQTGFVLNTTVGGYGITASYVQGKGIVVQTGNVALTTLSVYTGNPFNITAGNVTSAPFRVRVIKNL